MTYFLSLWKTPSRRRRSTSISITEVFIWLTFCRRIDQIDQDLSSAISSSTPTFSGFEHKLAECVYDQVMILFSLLIFVDFARPVKISYSSTSMLPLSKMSKRDFGMHMEKSIGNFDHIWLRFEKEKGRRNMLSAERPRSYI